MKNIYSVLLMCCILFIAGINKSYSFSIVKLPVNSERPGISKYLQVSELVKLSAKDYGTLTGKKMTMWDKISFKIMKMKMKHDLKKNPNLLISDYMSSKKTSTAINIVYYILIGILLFMVIILVLAGGKFR